MRESTPGLSSDREGGLGSEERMGVSRGQIRMCATVRGSPHRQVG